MSEYRVSTRWQRTTAGFTYEEYNREHTWSFDGGIRVRASAALAFRGRPDNVDPEEAFVASLSSCHLLTFLALAAKKRLVVDSYHDDAVGFMEKNPDGKLAMTRVILRPYVQFGGAGAPSTDDLVHLHERAHRECFIANSVLTAVTVEPAESTRQETPETAAPVVGGSVPILRVQSLSESIDYYVKVLGFKLDWDSPGIIASVSRDRCAIMLAEGDQGNPGAWVWIGINDVDPLFEEYRARGVTFHSPPTNYPWSYEMQVEDPDGNVLRFGSEPKADQPFGEWRDMRGDLWMKSPDGAWKRADV